MQQQYTTTRPRVSRPLGMFRSVAATALMMSIVTVGTVARSDFAGAVPKAQAADICSSWLNGAYVLDSANMVNIYGVVEGTVYLCGVHNTQERFGVWNPNIYGIGEMTLYVGGGCNTIAYNLMEKQFPTNTCSPGPAYVRATWNSLVAQTNTR